MPYQPYEPLTMPERNISTGNYQLRRAVVRPETLPDFQNPPLNEVVLGVQFSAPQEYTQIRAMEVWKLYQEQFPQVEEQQPLAPTFETFGLPATRQFNINLIDRAYHNRYWFLSPNKDELIQFQDDRLMHNWRKVGDQTNEYPRFERMIVMFQDEITRLGRYFKSLSTHDLAINQCEISYINHILIDDHNGLNSASDVFRFVNFNQEEPEDFSCVFRRPIYSENGSAIGRLTFEIQTAMPINAPSGGRMFVFTITARGAPSEPTGSGALEFLKVAREMVVNAFAQTTTDLAHQVWGKK